MMVPEVNRTLQATSMETSIILLIFTVQKIIELGTEIDVTYSTTPQ
jgi:hypothetical protein